MLATSSSRWHLVSESDAHLLSFHNLQLLSTTDTNSMGTNTLFSLGVYVCERHYASQRVIHTDCIIAEVRKSSQLSRTLLLLNCLAYVRTYVHTTFSGSHHMVFTIPDRPCPCIYSKNTESHLHHHHTYVEYICNKK